jgi:hypothetical protein
VSTGIGVKIEATAGEPKPGMTFAELRAFVTTAMRNNVADNAHISAKVTMGGKLKQVEVVAPGPAEDGRA